MLKGHLNILGHFWQRLTSLDHHRKSLEVVGTFLEILDIKRRKSHAFITQEKLGKYRLYGLFTVSIFKSDDKEKLENYIRGKGPKMGVFNRLK